MLRFRLISCSWKLPERSPDRPADPPPRLHPTCSHAAGSDPGLRLRRACRQGRERETPVVIARLAGLTPSVQIVPFRGEYYELKTSRQHLVNGLIYPVPNPEMPFLGVHLTRMIDGAVHAGPNAVLALSREGYRWTKVSPRDLLRTLTFPGFLKLASRNVGTGTNEVIRSFSKRRFARDLARLVPEISTADLVRSGAGVRAQAVGRDGNLVDDFVIQQGRNQIHILNAPSPAATSALEIADHISRMVA